MTDQEYEFPPGQGPTFGAIDCPKCGKTHYFDPPKTRGGMRVPRRCKGCGATGAPFAGKAKA